MIADYYRAARSLVYSLESSRWTMKVKLKGPSRTDLIYGVSLNGPASQLFCSAFARNTQCMQIAGVNVLMHRKSLITSSESLDSGVSFMIALLLVQAKSVI